MTDGGTVGRNMSTREQSLKNNDEQREADSLPEDGAGPSSQGAVDVDGEAQRQKPAKDLEIKTSRGREPIDSKRQTTGSPCCSPSRKVRLEEFIPASQVIDYELRDRYEVKLSSFAEGTKLSHVVDICKGVVQIRAGHNGQSVVWAFVRYASEEEAVTAAQALQGTVLNGAHIKASYCGERWSSPASRPEYLPDTLDVQRLPRKSRTAAEVAAIFPTGRVLMVTNTGHAKVKFSSSEELVAAVKKPECLIVRGEKLKFAMAVVSRKRPAKLENEDDDRFVGKDSDGLAENALSRETRCDSTRSTTCQTEDHGND